MLQIPMSLVLEYVDDRSVCDILQCRVNLNNGSGARTTHGPIHVSITNLELHKWASYQILGLVCQANGISMERSQNF